MNSDKGAYMYVNCRSLHVGKVQGGSDVSELWVPERRVIARRSRVDDGRYSGVQLRPLGHVTLASTIRHLTFTRRVRRRSRRTGRPNEQRLQLLRGKG